MLSTQINATSIRHKIRLTIGFVFFPAFRLFVFISRIIQTSPPTVEFNLSFFLNDKSICDGVFFFLAEKFCGLLFDILMCQSSHVAVSKMWKKSRIP